LKVVSAAQATGQSFTETKTFPGKEREEICNREQAQDHHFIFFNRHPVTVGFFVGTVTMPAAFLILLSAALGAGAVQAMRFLKLFRRGRKP
jgi:hypothetical protein